MLDFALNVHSSATSGPARNVPWLPQYTLSTGNSCYESVLPHIVPDGSDTNASFNDPTRISEQYLGDNGYIPATGPSYSDFDCQYSTSPIHLPPSPTSEEIPQAARRPPSTAADATQDQGSAGPNSGYSGFRKGSSTTFKKTAESAGWLAGTAGLVAYARRKDRKAGSTVHQGGGGGGSGERRGAGAAGVGSEVTKDGQGTGGSQNSQGSDADQSWTSWVQGTVWSTGGWLTQTGSAAGNRLWDAGSDAYRAVANAATGGYSALRNYGTSRVTNLTEQATAAAIASAKEAVAAYAKTTWDKHRKAVIAGTAGTLATAAGMSGLYWYHKSQS